MTLQEMTNALDEKLCSHVAQYHKFHDEFDKYRGHTLDENEAKEVEVLYNKIKDSMVEMSQVLNFITFRYEMALNELKAYKEFIEQLKQAQMLKERNGTN